MKPCPHSGRPAGCWHVRAAPDEFNATTGTVRTVCDRLVDYQLAVGDPDDACCENCLQLLER